LRRCKLVYYTSLQRLKSARKLGDAI
jgi:hypothetical protein